MYWPHANARRLSSGTAGLDAGGDAPRQLCASRDGALWLLVTRASVQVWSARPCGLLAASVRTARSIDEYGGNVAAAWRSDAGAIAVQTTGDGLLFYDVLIPGTPPFVYQCTAPHDYPTLAPSDAALSGTFRAGAGEFVRHARAPIGAGEPSVQLSFREAMRIAPGMCALATVGDDILVALRTPPAVQRIPWERVADDSRPPVQPETELLAGLPWLAARGAAADDAQDSAHPACGRAPGGGSTSPQHFPAPAPPAAAAHVSLSPPPRTSPAPTAHPVALVYSGAMDMHVWVLADGRACAVGGVVGGGVEGGVFWIPTAAEDAACMAAVNARFSVVALGHADGRVRVFDYESPTAALRASHTFDLRTALHSTASFLHTGRVLCAAWSSEGHALAVGWEHGWALWSTYGQLLCHSFRDDWPSTTRTFRDAFLFGTAAVLWGPGNTELLLGPTAGAAAERDGDTSVYAVPLLRAAAATQIVPDLAGRPLLQADDALLVYRGDVRAGWSLPGTDNDAWRTIPLPAAYLAEQWPLRCASQSADGQFIAAAGRRGLVHFSCTSGRWKKYTSAAQERSFAVRGGLLWFQHVLIAACDCGGETQLRVYSRDQELANANLLDLVVLPSAVAAMSLFDTSLLVYTADNALHHYLVTPTHDTIRLRACGSISFDGIIGEPARVRAVSWLVPPKQQRLGDPADDLSVARLLFLIDGKLAYLHPYRAGDASDALSYDLHILHAHVETFWTLGPAPSALAPSVWAFDGAAVCVWTDLLAASDVPRAPARVPMDVYPLGVLLDGGIVLGAETVMTIRRTLDTASFRTRAAAVLFVPHVLREHLRGGRLHTALELASAYTAYEYFSHILELLLHDVLEGESDARTALFRPLLPAVVHFLDHFREGLQVVARTARKSDVSRWPSLFAAAGRPPVLLRHTLAQHDLETAAAYLLVIHETEDEASALALTAEVLAALADRGADATLRDLLSFLRSLDASGDKLRESLRMAAAEKGRCVAVAGRAALRVPEHGAAAEHTDMHAAQQCARDRTGSGVAQDAVETAPVAKQAADARISDAARREPPRGAARHEDAGSVQDAALVEEDVLVDDAAPEDADSLAVEDTGAPPTGAVAPDTTEKGNCDAGADVPTLGQGRRPSSEPRRVAAASALRTTTPTAHALHQAARRASITLSPATLPHTQANGRIVMAPGTSPRIP
ncbi:WD40 repeat protein [Malassezia sp. CBS 17886]|nr:WD40 repeat protein [Malassezia sp. CBS 17886]